MRCPACNSEAPPGARGCGVCFASFDVVEAPGWPAHALSAMEPAGELRCDHCGAPLPSGALGCGVCYASVESLTSNVEVVHGPGWATALRSLQGVRYLGSHPSAPHPSAPLTVAIYDAGVALGRGGSVLRLPWERIVDFEGLDHEGVTSRVTATRVLLFGAVGLLAKKTTTNGYLQITDTDGIWLLEVPDATAMQVRSWALQARAGHVLPPATTPLAPPATSAADRLRALEDVRDLLSDEEYQAKRAAIIAEL